jgi:hypothetical protein
MHPQALHQRYRRSSLDGNLEYPPEIVGCPLRVFRVHDLCAVRCEAREEPAARDLPQTAAKSIDDIDSTPVSLRSEDQPGTVGRKARVPIVGRVVGEAGRFGLIDVPHPDVETAFSGAVRGEGYEVSVG